MNKINVIDGAKWFLSKNTNLRNGYLDENTKLNKLLYLTELMYYSVKKEKLFKEDFLAWPKGPVAKDVYANYRHSDLAKFSDQNFNKNKFDNSINKFFEVVDMLYANKSTTELVNISHSQDPWRKVQDLIPNNPLIDYSKCTDSLINEFKTLYELYETTDLKNLNKEKINGKIYFYYGNRDDIFDDASISLLNEIENDGDTFFIEKIDGEIVIS